MIPRSFKLVNRTWRVKLISSHKMAWHTAEMGHDYEKPYAGLCDPNEAIIYLSKDHVCLDDLVHSFGHELGHALQFAQGNFDRKNHDEVSIDKFGALFAQFWTTCKGDHNVQFER